MVPAFAHFDGIFHRLQGLGFQAWGAAVPEQVGRPADVGQRHGISAGAAGDALAEDVGVGKGRLEGVATGAGFGAVDGEDGIEEEALAQGDAFDGHGIVGGDVHGRKAGGDFQGVGRG